ncbi:unnamed protein product [Oikopleura dioica]|uniref:P-type domain-containing protein n=1 Tax=Oikopleura dioica TaxID=34765 RepID=E4WWH9_OIKDI|nr:unnamed protein product [Oikopleura dioica]
MLLRYFSVFAIAFASTCTTLNRIQCGGNQTLDWGESECVGASCCWNPNVVDILYRCTKNDQDAQIVLNARRNDTNYVDILNEVIAYHDARASWSVPFYTAIPFVVRAAYDWIKKIYQDN